jgi:hypothetical protein
MAPPCGEDIAGVWSGVGRRWRRGGLGEPGHPGRNTDQGRHELEEARMEIQIGIEDAAREEIAGELNRLLADSLTLYSKTQD